MAGPNDPTSTNNPATPNIDTTDSVNALSKLDAAIKQYGASTNSVVLDAAKKWEDYQKSIQDSKTTLDLFNTVSTAADKAFRLLSSGVDKVAAGFADINKMSKQAAEGTALVTSALLGSSKALSGINKDSSLNTFSSQIIDVIGDATDFTDHIKNLATTFGISLDKVGQVGAFEEVKKQLMNVGDAIDKHLNMSRAIFNMSAQSGQLQSIFGQQQVNFKDVNTAATDYEHALNNVAFATGTSFEEAGKMFNALGRLPKAFNDNSTAAATVSNQMANLQSVITLARGTGQEFSAVLDQQSKMMNTFNITAEQATQLTGRASELNQKFGINIADTTGFLTEMAGAFKNLGDNTESASAIFNSVFQGLREGGLGIKPAVETITQMTESIAHLSVAQKAFISSRTGGPGGLLGAVQMEQALAAPGGKGAKDVFDKIRQSFLQQVGGQIITRDQVQTQAQAAQFERQRQLLQSPAFGGIAKTEEQASALLKAFSEPTAKGLVDVKNVLAKPMADGVSLQATANTILSSIQKGVEDLKQQGGAVGLDVLQQSLTEMGNQAVTGSLQARRAAATTETQSAAAGTLVHQTATEQYAKGAIQGLARDLPTAFTSVAQLGSALKQRFMTPQTQQQEQAKAQQVFEQQMRENEAKHHNEQAAQIAAHATVGRAVHRATTANTAPHTPAIHPVVPPRADVRSPNAAGGTGTSNATVVNVYIDGKKIMPDHINATQHQTAQGPVR